MIMENALARMAVFVSGVINKEMKTALVEETNNPKEEEERLLMVFDIKKYPTINH